MIVMRRIALLGLVSFAVAAPSASASGVLAPPGHAGANQYVEVIPTSGGNVVPPGAISGSGSATALPGALDGLGHGRITDAKLARLGTDGRAAALLAAATAPTPASPAAASNAGGTAPTNAGGAAAKPEGPVGSIAGGLTHALTGSGTGGLGLALPLLLGTAAVAAVGIAVVRLRRGAGFPEA